MNSICTGLNRITKEKPPFREDGRVYDTYSISTGRCAIAERSN